LPKLLHDDFLYLLIQICVTLVIARGFGELFKNFRQPAVVGEIIGGVLLGPSVFKNISPSLFHELFFSHPNATTSMDGIYSISLVMLLFISGMEIELPLIWKNGRSATYISIIGMVIPLSIGFGSGWFFYTFFDGTPGGDKLVFALFLGTALSITALPVIAKILFDLNLLNSRIGSLIITCAMLNDFVGWNLFSIVLGMMPHTSRHIATMSVWQTVLFTVLFAVLTLTLFKFFLNRILRFINSQFKGPGGSVTVAMAFCFIAAIFTEYIGMHAVFGAFIMGIAFGDSLYFPGRSKDIIHQFVLNIFAPLFFVSIGLNVDFVKYFDPGIVAAVLLIAFITKVLGGYIGGRLGKLSTSESLAVGFGINARGAMEIVLGLVALQAGLISEKIFVALTIMAIITSLTSGNFIRYFLNKHNALINSRNSKNIN
jgi:Kef-type K+ transport system membrane component KefB